MADVEQYVEDHFEDLAVEFVECEMFEGLDITELFWRFAEDRATDALDNHDDDEDYDRWKEQQLEN